MKTLLFFPLLRLLALVTLLSSILAAEEASTALAATERPQAARVKAASPEQ
jgi:hypothetical protein